MMKIALYAALMLFPLLSFAKNYCETCGRDISQAKNARQCAGCSIRETVGSVIDCFRHPDKKTDQIKAPRRSRRLGDVAEWHLIGLNEYFKFNIVFPDGEYPLNYTMRLSVKDNRDRIRILLRDAADTIIYGGKDGKVVKFRGVYVFDNLPICLPGRPRMFLFVRRCSVDSIEYLVTADDGTGHNLRTAHGTAKSPSITDFSWFR